MAMFRPAGWDGPLLLEGRGRDLLTPRTGAAPILLGEDTLAAEVVKPDLLARLTTAPEWPEARALEGQPAIAGFRRRLAELVAARADRERPLGTLLDDIAACTLISSWILLHQPGSPLYDYSPDPARRSRMANVCIGFSPDSDAFRPPPTRPKPVQVADLPLSSDADGWHPLRPAAPFDMRRARRIDVWQEADRLIVDAMFQDSALLDDGTRRAVHDYGLIAAFDAGSGTLLEIAAQPRILPHDACPRAVDGVRGLIGTAAPMLREQVLDVLRGPAGCTHLNDAVRALAAVPTLGMQLAAALDETG